MDAQHVSLPPSLCFCSPHDPQDYTNKSDMCPLLDVFKKCNWPRLALGMSLDIPKHTTVLDSQPWLFSLTSPLSSQIPYIPTCVHLFHMLSSAWCVLPLSTTLLFLPVKLFIYLFLSPIENSVGAAWSPWYHSAHNIPFLDILSLWTLAIIQFRVQNLFHKRQSFLCVYVFKWEYSLFVLVFETVSLCPVQAGPELIILLP